MADIYEIFKFPDISEHVKDVCVNKIGITFPPILTDEEYNSLSAEEKEMRTRQKHIYWDWAATIRFAWQKGYLEGKQKFAKSLYESGLSTENIAEIMDQSPLAIELLLSYSFTHDS
jgi:hypothetical protein